MKGPLCLPTPSLQRNCPEPGKTPGLSEPSTHAAFKAISLGPQYPSPHLLGFHSMLGMVPSLWIPRAATQKEGSVIICIL